MLGAAVQEGAVSIPEANNRATALTMGRMPDGSIGGVWATASTKLHAFIKARLQPGESIVDPVTKKVDGKLDPHPDTVSVGEAHAQGMTDKTMASHPRTCNPCQENIKSIDPNTNVENPKP